MARRKKLLKFIFGIALGFVLSQLTTTYNNLAELEHYSYIIKPLISENSSKSISLLPPEVTTENNLLFVGVMTASKYLENRAKAVYETWGREVPGKIAFFSSGYSQSDSVPLVPLPGIDDSYPPQRKSFTMLKYMHDHYIDHFEWFLRADDDVYVRTDRIESLLRSVDSRKPWFIGQTGRGNRDEFGLLSLENDENFCMGGPGVIISRETLKRMAPFIDECLQNLVTNHEDVELGRCVRRFAGISCTWSYEMQVIFYHNTSGQAAFTGDLKQKEVHRAITLHPIKQPQYMYRLHNYIKGLRIQDNLQESLKLHRDIRSSMAYLGVDGEHLQNAELVQDLPLFPEPRGSRGYLGDPSILGTSVNLNRFRPESLRDLLDWEFISTKTVYSAKDLNPRKKIISGMKEGFNDITREIMDLINVYSRQRGRVIDFKETIYAYFRLDPNNGADLIFDLLLIYRKYRGHKMTVHVRRHAYVQQTFTGIYIKEADLLGNSTAKKNEITQTPLSKQLISNFISQLGDNIPFFESAPNNRPKVINFVLPLLGRYPIFKRFLTMYEARCIKEQEDTTLTIVLYKSDSTSDDYTNTLRLIYNTQNKYPSHVIRILGINEAFSRGRALQYAANSSKEGDLLLFIDVDMVFDSSTLLRIRHNTIRNKTVYFPIVYSLYNPHLLNKSYPVEDYLIYNNIIDDTSGYWRQFGFGIVSLYKSDFMNLGGFNTSLYGWGYEDVTFYDNVVKSNLTVVRSVDPGLIHVYHPIECDSTLEIAQKNMCIGTQASTYGSLKILQKYFKKYKHLLLT